MSLLGPQVTDPLIPWTYLPHRQYPVAVCDWFYYWPPASTPTDSGRRHPGRRRDGPAHIHQHHH
jgi:hypothetical protein